MGTIKKIIGGTLAIGGILGLYKFIGLKWTAIIVTIIIVLYIIIKIAGKKKGEEYKSDNGGYFSGLFTD